jgi:hypothetical protein
MQGFWRELYHPGAFNKKYITDAEKKKMANQRLKESGILDLTELVIKAQMSKMEAENEYQTILLKEYNVDGWHKHVSEAPDQLNFWFDFLDAESELGQFSVKAVGDRVKAVNDTSVTAIYFRKVPDLIFTTHKQYNESGLADKSGYTPVFINGTLENMFNISA